MKARTEDFIKEISQSLFAAKRYYEMWWFLRGTNRPKYVDVLNQYNAFSRGLIGATFDSAIVALYKVTEVKSGTFNIDLLLKRLAADTRFSKQEVDAYKTRLKAHATAVNAIKILRNNVVGHSSESLNYKASFIKAGIKPSEWKALINELIGIVCEVSDKIDGLFEHQDSFADRSINDMHRLFDDLQIGDAAKAKRRVR